ncbi:NUDIX domain-containing protein [Candidatus Saccharibacteria bacterium]|nr:NUDIX domain-containing protein [Candidatus Saccharibacteria bacterium]
MFEYEERELLDVVNENDEIIDSIHRGDMMKLRDTPGRYLRVIELFLQRPDGDIYLPRRSPHKKIFPGSLDHSAAGHINKGETYEQALVRETREELGIETTPDNFIFIKKFAPTKELFYFRNFYLLRTDKFPKLSPEHTEAAWIAPNKLEEFLNKDVPAKHTIYEDIPVLLWYFSQESMQIS